MKTRSDRVTAMAATAILLPGCAMVPSERQDATGAPASGVSGHQSSSGSTAANGRPSLLSAEFAATAITMEVAFFLMISGAAIYVFSESKPSRRFGLLQGALGVILLAAIIAALVTSPT